MKKNKKSTDWGSVGCGSLLALLIAIPVTIVLAIFWECPGDSMLAQGLWDLAKLPWLLGIVFGPIGLTLYGMERGKVEGCDTPVTAVVAEIQVEKQRSAESRATYETYTPIYAYTLGGETIRVKGRNYSLKKEHYQVGQQTNMLVCPGDPAKYYIQAETKKTYAVSKAFLWVGLPLMALGAVLWLASLVLALAGA